MKTRYAVLMSLAFFLGSQPAMAAEQTPPSGSSSPPAAVAEAGPRLLELVNRERADAGLGALETAHDAAGIAQDWSGQMARAGELSHNDDYFTPASMERLRAVRLGENVAFAETIDEIHDMLMHSPPHRKNILNPEFRQVGFGAVRTSDGLLYVTQDFLTRRSEPADGRSAGSARPAARSKAGAPASDSPRASSPSPKPRPAAARPASSRRPRPGSPPAASRPAADGAPRPVPDPAQARSAAAATSQPAPPPAPAAAPAPAPAPATPPTDAVSTAAEPAGAGTPAVAPTDTADASPASTDTAPSPADSAPASEPAEAMPALTAAGASRPAPPARHRDMLVGAAALALLTRFRRR